MVPFSPAPAWEPVGHVSQVTHKLKRGGNPNFTMSGRSRREMARKWELAARFLAENPGCSTRALARFINVSHNTAKPMRQRIEDGSYAAEPVVVQGSQVHPARALVARSKLGKAPWTRTSHPMGTRSNPYTLARSSPDLTVGEDQRSLLLSEGSGPGQEEVARRPKLPEGPKAEFPAAYHKSSTTSPTGRNQPLSIGPPLGYADSHPSPGSEGTPSHIDDNVEGRSSSQRGDTNRAEPPNRAEQSEGTEGPSPPHKDFRRTRDEAQDWVVKHFLKEHLDLLEQFQKAQQLHDYTAASFTDHLMWKNWKIHFDQLLEIQRAPRDDPSFRPPRASRPRDR